MRDMIEEMGDSRLDSEGDVLIGYLTFSRSQILRELDPIAYEQEVSALADALISDLQDELENLDPEVDAEEIQDIQDRIDALESI